MYITNEEQVQEIEVTQEPVPAGSDMLGDAQRGQNRNSVISDATKGIKRLPQVIDKTPSWVLVLPSETFSLPASSLFTAKKVEWLKQNKNISLSC